MTHRTASRAVAVSLVLAGLTFSPSATAVGSAGMAPKSATSADGGTQVLTITDDAGDFTAEADKAAVKLAKSSVAKIGVRTEGSGSDAEDSTPESNGSRTSQVTGRTPQTESSQQPTESRSSPASEEKTGDADGQSPADDQNGDQDGGQRSQQTVPGYLYVSEPLATKPFGVAGVTWNDGQNLPAGGTVEMRTLDGGAWSEWYVLAVEAESGKGRPGTEANVSGASTGVQLRIKGEGSLPSGLRLELVDGQGKKTALDPKPASVDAADTLTAEVVNGDEKQSILSGQAAGVPSASQYGQAEPTELPSPGRGLSVPQSAAVRSLTSGQRSKAVSLAGVRSRSAWGANESAMTWSPSYAPMEGAIVHHTAGSNSYTQAQVPATIRGIYSYHAVTREWGDIGYNILIDKYGGRWEGRSGTLASPDGKIVTGAHAAPRNQGTLGVSVLGTYDSSNLPTSQVLQSVSDVIASRFAIAGIDPASRSGMTVPSGTGAALTAGSTLPRISGHKDVKSTSCPGSIYGYLDQIRSQVAAKQAQIASSQAVGVTWRYAKDAIDVGVAVAQPADHQYRWTSYNVAHKQWDLISDWSDGNWSTWRASAGTYWLHVQVRSRADGSERTSTIAFQYVAGESRITGTYAGWQPEGSGMPRHVLLGNVSKAHSVVTKIYDVGAKTWVAQFQGQWARWFPKKGVYWTRYEAYTADGRLADERTYAFGVD